MMVMMLMDPAQIPTSLYSLFAAVGVGRPIKKHIKYPISIDSNWLNEIHIAFAVIKVYVVIVVVVRLTYIHTKHSLILIVSVHTPSHPITQMNPHSLVTGSL